MVQHCAAGGAIFFSTHVLEVVAEKPAKVAIIKKPPGGGGPMDEVRGQAS